MALIVYTATIIHLRRAHYPFTQERMTIYSAEDRHLWQAGGTP
jgi:hypothetical protein